MKRWWYLSATCVTFFALEISFDQTAPLVGRLTGQAQACSNGKDADCLHFSATEFNSLYVALFWAGCVSAVCTGFFIGRFGVWVTTWVSASLISLGMIFFTIGPYMTGSAGAYASMLFGRIFLATGGFAQIVLSHQIKSHWFFGRELALAFAVYQTSSRVGGILALATVGAMAESVGLQNTLWITFSISLLAPICTILSGYLYEQHAVMDTTHTVGIHLEKSEFRELQFGFRKIQRLGKEFWILSGIIFFFFGSILTLIADFPKFLAEQYGYSEATAGLITGIIPDIGVLAPLFGFIIDKFGARDILNLIAAGLFFLGLLFLAAIPNFLPFITCIFAALAFAIFAGGVWGCIPVITAPDVVGVAMGVGLSLQALASGLFLLITGVLLDQTALTNTKRWEIFFVFLCCCVGLAVILSLASMYFDWKSPSRPLRSKHALAIPSVAADTNPVLDELTPLLRGEKPTDYVGPD